VSSNQDCVRAFTDVVSLEAWHDEFGKIDGRAQIYAAVGFRTARVGSEKERPVWFRLSIKRAEIHLIIPDTEPVKVDPRTVARSPIEQPGKRSITTERRQETSLGAKLGSGADFGSASAQISLKANIERNDHQTMVSTIREVREDLF
jgi:hypothetical protein